MNQLRCISCGDMNVKDGICSKCGSGQLVELLPRRTYECSCQSGQNRMTVCTVKKGEVEQKFCIVCLPNGIATALADVLVRLNGTLSHCTQSQHDAIRKLASISYWHERPPRAHLEAMEAVLSHYYYRQEHNHTFIE